MASLDMQQTVLTQIIENEPAQEEIQLTELLPVKQCRIIRENDIFDEANVSVNTEVDTGMGVDATDALKVLRSFSIADECDEEEQEFHSRNNFAFCRRVQRQGKYHQPRKQYPRKENDEYGRKDGVDGDEIEGNEIIGDRIFDEGGTKRKKKCADRKTVKASKKRLFDDTVDGKQGNEVSDQESINREEIEQDVYRGHEKRNYLVEYNEEPTYLDLDKNNHLNDEIYVFRREPIDSEHRKEAISINADEIYKNNYPVTTDGPLFARLEVSPLEPSENVVETIVDKRISDNLEKKSNLKVETNYFVEGENNNVVQSSRSKAEAEILLSKKTKKIVNREENGNADDPDGDDGADGADGADEGGGGNTDISKEENQQKKYCCVVCDARFKGSGGLRNHYKIVHGAGPIFKCDECGKEFPLKERLKLHVRTHTGFKPYKCSECDKSFARGGQLVQHRRTHSQVKPYRCGLCSGTFTCAANLALHVKRHNGQKDHKCEICGRAFVRRDALKKHLECLHRDVKSFLCVICNKTFKGHLPQHMRTHARDRPHGCATCGQRFAQKSQLTVHQRTHSGQRPFRCLVCWQAFAHSTALKLHTRRHTGERPFKCDECNAGFTQLPHWKKHMKCIHGRNEPYACKKCKSFFRIKNDLECHEKSCHPEFATDHHRRPSDGSSNSDAPSSNDDVDKPSPPSSKYRLMTVERMRLLLAVLLKRISKQERLDELGFGKRLIDEVLHDSLISAGKDPVVADGLSELETLTKNLEIFLKWTVPKEHWENFRRLNKSPEDILEALTAT